MTDSTMRDWIARIRAEYLESPGLRLTSAQARRLWGLDRAACEVLLAELVNTKFLKRTWDQTYVRAA